MKTPSRVPFTAGRLVRRGIRRQLDVIGVRYVEDRGVLDSQFTLLDPTDDQLEYVQDLVLRIQQIGMES